MSNDRARLRPAQLMQLDRQQAQFDRYHKMFDADGPPPPRLLPPEPTPVAPPPAVVEEKHEKKLDEYEQRVEDHLEAIKTLGIRDATKLARQFRKDLKSIREDT